MKILKRKNKSPSPGKKIYLQMSLSKSLQKDEFGNVIFEVEASNENLDAQDQRVLQVALIQSKDYFLKNGVVSKDHKHRTFRENGGFDVDERYVIGEPLDVFTNGKKTMVRGKLYANNEFAKKFIELIETGSSRIKASVGGLLPKIKKTIESGMEIGQVISVLWDDLALTITPVNPTVEPAMILCKSMSAAAFIKTLSGAVKKNNLEVKSMRKSQRASPEVRRVFHKATLEAAKPILIDAVARGELDVIQASRIETAINQCINNPTQRLSPKYANFLTKKLAPPTQGRRV